MRKIVPRRQSCLRFGGRGIDKVWQRITNAYTRKKIIAFLGQLIEALHHHCRFEPCEHDSHGVEKPPDANAPVV